MLLFSISCPGIGDGAPAGKYKVLVSWIPAAGSPGAKLLGARKKKNGYDPNDFSPSDPFGGRYSNPGKPAFTAEIKPGENDLSFELKD